MEISKLSNFSVLMSFSDNGKSVLDCVMPFIEYGIAKMSKEYIQVSDLKQFIMDECLIDIPTNTVKTLLKRLKRDDKLTDYENWTIIRIVDNYKISSNSYVEKIHDFSRDTKQFIRHCCEYCSFSITDEILSDKVFSFIKTYQHCINTQDGVVSIRLDSVSEDDYLIANFIDHISNDDKNDYTTFKNIFYGFILSQFITKGDNLDRHKICNITVYLDTDFLLRVLDFQAQYFTIPSKELLALMENYGFKIVVLPEVVEEARAVLYSNYLKFCREGNNLKALHGQNIVNLDGVLGAFFRRNMTSAQIGDYIDTLEKNIESANIDLLKMHIQSNVQINEKELDKIIEYKKKSNRVDYITDESEKNRALEKIGEKAKLDANLLGYIRKMRSNKIFRFQDARHILLSCDNTICKVNKYFHDRDNTIPECINENSFTNMLFICNPNQIGDAPIALLLSIFQSSKYVDYDILCRFHSGVKEYIEKNPQEQQYLTGVFRNQNLFAELNGYYSLDNDGTTIETDFIRSLFESSKSALEQSEKEKAALTDENLHLKKELDESKKATQQIPANIPIEKLFEADQPSNIENTKQAEPNLKAEKILRTSIITVVALIILVLLFVWIFNTDFGSFTLTLSWWSKCSMYLAPVVFMASLGLHLYDKEVMSKIIDNIIYDKKSEPLWVIYFMVIIKSALWMLTTFILPLISLFITK